MNSDLNFDDLIAEDAADAIMRVPRGDDSDKLTKSLNWFRTQRGVKGA